MKKSLSIIFLLSIIISCKEQPKLSGVDLDAWKLAVDGCNEERLAIVDGIVTQQDKLKGLSENRIKDILGKPDQHELYERSQKFFIYHLEKGNKCADYEGGYFKSFYIRFNSLDQAVAFTIQEIK